VLFGDDHVWPGFAAERVVPGWIVGCAVVTVKKRNREKRRF